MEPKQAGKLDEQIHTLIEAGFTEIYVGDIKRTPRGVNPGAYPEEMTITIYCSKKKGVR